MGYLFFGMTSNKIHCHQKFMNGVRWHFNLIKPIMYCCQYYKYKTRYASEPYCKS